MNLRQLVKRSVPLVCTYYLVDDWRAGRRLGSGRIETDSGRRHAGRDLATSLGYIEGIYRDYLDYGEIERFSGVVGEIGPGDNFGVALLARGGGAERVVAIDRFYSRRDPEYQAAVYEALAGRHALHNLFDGAPGETTLTGLDYRAGTPAEQFFRSAGISFDYIISRAVLEHLYDPLGALEDMTAALNPGGVLIHRIDLRDHGMFASHHPLTFLTIPEIIYRRMVRSAGRPNRVLLPAYRDWLANSPLEGSLRITRLVGIDEEVGALDREGIPGEIEEQALRTVAAIRPRLGSGYRDMDPHDLAVSGVVLVAQKARDGAGLRPSVHADSDRAGP